MRTSKIGLLASLAFATACAGSSGGTPSPGSPELDSGSASAVTFTKVYGDIISPMCTSCHNPSGVGVRDGHLDMMGQSTAFSNLVGVPAMGSMCGGHGTRVVAGDADTSVLYHKVTTPTCGAGMPLGGLALSSAEADEIKSWINGGARND